MLFSHGLGGPFARLTRLLGLLGASIIKVEPLAGAVMRHSDAIFHDGSQLGRLVDGGKRSIVLDLKRPEAVHVLERLAVRADVTIIDLRPEAAKRLGIDPSSLHVLNECLIVYTVTGFGWQNGNAPGHDINYLALTGCWKTRGCHHRSRQRMH